MECRVVNWWRIGSFSGRILRLFTLSFSLSLSFSLPTFMHSATSGRVKEAPVIIRQPSEVPQFDSALWPDGKFVYVNPDAGGFELPCAATGNPTPTYFWKLNGHLLAQNYSHNAFSYSYGTNDGTLRFQSFGQPLEGTYQCFATGGTSDTSRFVVASEIVVLKIIKAPSSFEDSAPAIPLPVRLGQYQKLPCTIDLSLFVPPASVDWTDDDEISVVSTNVHHEIDYQGMLHVLSVSPKLADKSVKCVAYQKESNTRVTGQTFKIEVLDVTQQSFDRPPFLVYPTNTNGSTFIFVRNEAAKVTCLFAGSPVPIVTFHKGSVAGPAVNESKTSGLVVKRGTISWSKINEDDQGDYYCKGVNSNESWWQFRVVVQSAPSLSKLKLISKAYFNLIPGSTLDINCATNAIPPARVTWYKNGVQINSKNIDRRATISQDTLTYKVRHVEATDSAVMMCNASNQHGYDFVNIYVNVGLFQVAPVTIATILDDSIDSETTFDSIRYDEGRKEKEGFEWPLMLTIFGIAIVGILSSALIVYLLCSCHHATAQLNRTINRL